MRRWVSRASWVGDVLDETWRCVGIESFLRCRRFRLDARRDEDLRPAVLVESLWEEGRSFPALEVEIVLVAFWRCGLGMLHLGSERLDISWLSQMTSDVQLQSSSVRSSR